MNFVVLISNVISILYNSTLIIIILELFRNHSQWTFFQYTYCLLSCPSLMSHFPHLGANIIHVIYTNCGISNFSRGDRFSRSPFSMSSSGFPSLFLVIIFHLSSLSVTGVIFSQFGASYFTRIIQTNYHIPSFPLPRKRTSLGESLAKSLAYNPIRVSWQDSL